MINLLNTPLSENAIIDNNDMHLKTKKQKKAKTIYNYIYIFLKRTIDIIAGIVGIIILIPLFFVVVIMRIKNKENNGPIFYEHLRIGKNGKTFRMYKFRSMVIGADEKLKEYLKENPDEAKYYKEYKKLKNDPRVTKTGRFLRMTSLDEWPQFINLLCGSMTLVGPRPYLPSEKEDMGKYYDTIIKVKPGITGPWQVSGRSKISFEDRLKKDIEYCNNHGLKKDLIILLKTTKKVIKKEGAL